MASIGVISTKAWRSSRPPIRTFGWWNAIRGGPFNEQSTLSEYYHYSVKAVPGVEKASPFIYYNVERQIGDQSRHFSIIGYDVFSGLGGPQKIVAGRGIGHAHYEMVADKKLGAKLGDRVPLGLHTYTVVGLTQGAIDTNGDPLVFLSLPDAQEVAFQKDNEEVRTQRERLARTLNGQKSFLRRPRPILPRPWRRTPTSSTPSWCV